ncbi:MAG: acyltransferase family protein [Promethearchaeota archaeon]
MKKNEEKDKNTQINTQIINNVGFRKSNNERIDHNHNEETKSALTKKRIRSIDSLRGFDMFWITGGTDVISAFFVLFFPTIAPLINSQFHHCDWNGFRFYDLIFPLFIFIAGLSIPFSINNRKIKGQKDSEIYKHIFKRTLLLFLCGFLYYNLEELITWNYQNFRWMGVLQRIAITYCIAALFEMKLKPKKQIIVICALLVGYWLILLLVPVPGYGFYNLTQEGNLPFYIDRLLLPGRLCCFPNGENEGILSTMPAIASTMLGVSAGHWLQSEISDRRKILGFEFFGIICLVIALLWNIIFPINKYLWSSSFALYAGGWSFILFGFFYYFIDVKNYFRVFFFFIIIGSNALLIYLFGGIIDLDFIGYLIFDSSIYPQWFLFIIKFLEIAVRWLILLYLYKKNKFFRV